jgi:hypothetical protein
VRAFVMISVVSLMLRTHSVITPSLRDQLVDHSSQGLPGNGQGEFVGSRSKCVRSQWIDLRRHVRIPKRASDLLRGECNRWCDGPVPLRRAASRSVMHTLGNLAEPPRGRRRSLIGVTVGWSGTT